MKNSTRHFYFGAFILFLVGLRLSKGIENYPVWLVVLFAIIGVAALVRGVMVLRNEKQDA